MPKTSDDKIDLDRVTHWVFDLDNTLYPHSSNLFHQIDKRMKAFISEAFDMPLEDAFRLQKKYYREHGTTLRGLMDNHDINPDEFLAFVHDIDHSILSPNPALHEALTKLEGRKLIYTNGSARHAERVIDALGVTGHFDDIFDIKAGGYVPKPDEAPYDVFIERHGVSAETAVMLEDSFRNLGPAADRGMTTVWVQTGDFAPADPEELAHCDFVIDDVTDWLGGLVHKG